MATNNDDLIEISLSNIMQCCPHHSRQNIYTVKSDYAKVSAIPHDTPRITTDMPVILYAITTRCLSFGICLNPLFSLINTA